LKESSKPNLYLALMHYPVVNKNGDKIASAVTNLDLHDISRAAKTYEVKAFYVVTPLADQKELVEKIISHWVSGKGAEYNPKRCKALELVIIKDSLKDILEDIRLREKGLPKTVVTSAKSGSGNISYGRFREMLKEKGQPYLLLFGTAWGLSEEIITAADYILDPIMGNSSYNHLSVRSAASIILDRLTRVEV
jgi:hypothetical protein